MSKRSIWGAVRNARRDEAAMRACWQHAPRGVSARRRYVGARFGRSTWAGSRCVQHRREALRRRRRRQLRGEQRAAGCASGSAKRNGVCRLRAQPWESACVLAFAGPQVCVAAVWRRPFAPRGDGPCVDAPRSPPARCSTSPQAAAAPDATRKPPSATRQLNAQDLAKSRCRARIQLPRCAGGRGSCAAGCVPVRWSSVLRLDNFNDCERGGLLARGAWPPSAAVSAAPPGSAT